MKKFWMIAMLLIAALFFVSCGGDDEEEGGNNNQQTGDTCPTAGAFQCKNIALSQVCNNGFWQNYEECTGDKTCNAASGKCEAATSDNGDTAPAGDTGADTGDTGTDTGDTGSQGGDTGDTGSNTDYGCYDILVCMNGCGETDQTCMENCFYSGTAKGQEDYNAMAQCAQTYCSNTTDYASCYETNCKAQADACHMFDGGSSQPGNSSYNAPYGSLSLNFSIDQVGNDSDGEQSQIGIAQSAFANGTYGNNGTAITPADAYMIQSSAYYYNQQGSTGVQVQQVPVYVQGNQGVGGNPVVILDIPAENIGVGALTTSLFQGAQSMLYVVDVNWNSGQISCFHAFGEGDINISNAGDVANHGALALTGNVTLYSPANYAQDQGDISSQLGVQVCQPK